MAMGVYCDNCKHKEIEHKFDKWPCMDCCEGDRRDPITEADLFRAMTDEELAAFFAQQKYRRPVFDGWLPLCNHVMGPRICHEDGCEKCWLEWLKQEATG